MTKGFSNSNSFVTTLTSTINFLTRGLQDLTRTVLYMKQNYVTMTKLKMTIDFYNLN